MQCEVTARILLVGSFIIVILCPIRWWNPIREGLSEGVNSSQDEEEKKY
ncbi:hypothetical protein BofuT4_uP069100.1 [Botrytis cinerea T4]|uniref:Uncharacterized protein n=1 Tax=Botryotinia fuckeliana (strain T4) TaxID=999810 RepID=G2XQG5_BOTF4|nr:hypothetical protein BofuT4_uP069100.1 [Botrytis cinerea T4]